MTYRLVLLLLCVLPIIGQAQADRDWQDLVNRKQYTTVIDKVGTLTASDSANVSTMYAIGQAYEGLLRYRDAYQYYRYCFAMDTTNTDMLNTVARMAVSVGKAAEAEQLFRKVLENDSLNFYANHQLARLYYQTGDYEKAIDRYTNLIQYHEQNSALLAGLGNCYTKLEQYFPAVTSYFLAYNYNRENAGLASNLINSMLRLGGDYVEEAITICDTALYYNPGNRQILRNKGMALYMSKRYADADTLYTGLMEAGDSTYLTLKYGGICRYQAGQYLNAVDPLEAAYKADTTSVDVCLFLGSALGKTFDRKRAFALFDKAEKNMQPPAGYLAQLKMFRAETYQKDGKRDLAEKMYYELWQEFPDRTDFLAQIDRLYSGDIFNIKQEKAREKALFIKTLYIRKILEKGSNAEFLFFRRKDFEKLYNEMFFRQTNTLPMLAPDGKKSTISIMEIREILNQLPEELPS